ncbi:unknown [Clostridium sp. CAG:492]|jgi:hypothetical protein|nr:unknown [Clostridium sp. CAG:492]
MIKFIICIVTVYILINSISYGIYELKEQKNKVGGITSVALGIFQCVFTNTILFMLNR